MATNAKPSQIQKEKDAVARIGGPGADLQMQSAMIDVLLKILVEVQGIRAKINDHVVVVDKFR